jgi:hypothetical protein
MTMADGCMSERSTEGIVKDLRADPSPLHEEAARKLELLDFNFKLQVRVSYAHHAEMATLREQLRLANLAIIKRNRRIKNLRQKFSLKADDGSGSDV